MVLVKMANRLSKRGAIAKGHMRRVTTHSFNRHYRLGLRRNPFGGLTAVEWAQTAFLLPKLEQLLHEEVHLQLLGPIGVGKTATLHRMGLQFEKMSMRYEYVPDGRASFQSDLSQISHFFLDEAQRLNRGWRKRWLAWAAVPGHRTLFGTHRDLTTHFVKQGLPLQTVRINEVIDEAYYTSWLNGRIAHFAIPQTETVSFSAEGTRFLYQQFGIKMREAEYFLYELFEDLETDVILTPSIIMRHLQKYGPSPNFR